ncbi:MAG: hypothetical protein U0132_16875 [Gemmatimonadaceae bacterium]
MRRRHVVGFLAGLAACATSRSAETSAFRGDLLPERVALGVRPGTFQLTLSAPAFVSLWAVDGGDSLRLLYRSADAQPTPLSGEVMLEAPGSAVVGRPAPFAGWDVLPPAVVRRPRVGRGRMDVGAPAGVSVGGGPRSCRPRRPRGWQVGTPVVLAFTRTPLPPTLDAATTAWVRVAGGPERASRGLVRLPASFQRTGPGRRRYLTFAADAANAYGRLRCIGLTIYQMRRS